MTITINANDSIHIPSLHVSTSVGNGGNGYSYGDIYNKAYSSIDQSNSAGSTNTVTVDPAHVHSSIDANTYAHQSNSATVDQQANVMAGIGGAGGNDNVVFDSGNVSFDLGSQIHV